MSGEVVELGKNRPPIHLSLIDLLGSVVESRGIAKAYGICGCEESEEVVWMEDLILVKEREGSVCFEDALYDEHDVSPCGIVFVEAECDGISERPGEDSFEESGDLFSLFEDDSVPSDEVESADVAVEVDADARPVESGGDLFDVGRLAGSVVPLDDDASVKHKSGEDGKGCVWVEDV